MLGWVPRAGSPASSLLLRHSDFSCPGRARLLASLRRSGSLPEATRSPRFLGNPCARAPISDPGGGAQAETPGWPPCVLACSLLPSASFTASASTWLRLSGLNAAARALAVYASQPPSRTDHARLASGWRSPALAGWDFHPRVTLKVSHRYMMILFLQAFLAQGRSRFAAACGC